MPTNNTVYGDVEKDHYVIVYSNSDDITWISQKVNEIMNKKRGWHPVGGVNRSTGNQNAMIVTQVMARELH